MADLVYVAKEENEIFMAKVYLNALHVFVARVLFSLKDRYGGGYIWNKLRSVVLEHI